MSWQAPINLFGHGVSDRRMMEEILELLAASSPSSSEENMAGSFLDGVAGLDDPPGGTNHEDCFMDGDMHDCDERMNTPNEDISFSFEEDKKPQKQVADSEVGSTLQQKSIFGPPRPTEQAGPLSKWPPLMQDIESKASVPEAPSPINISVAPPSALAQSLPQERPSPASNVLRTGQRVHVMNSAEFRELRRKLRMQVASRRFRRRKKNESRQKKMQIQALQTELAHLLEVEGQMKRYEHFSTQALQEELHNHEQEIASLAEKVHEAAKEELEWVEH